jgi:hypothetical protein
VRSTVLKAGEASVLSGLDAQHQPSLGVHAGVGLLLGVFDLCRVVADAPAKPAYFGQGVGIGFRKEDEDLRDAFDRAIVQVMKDGSYDRIRARYFAFDIR